MSESYRSGGSRHELRARKLAFLTAVTIPATAVTGPLPGLCEISHGPPEGEAYPRVAVCSSSQHTEAPNENDNPENCRRIARRLADGVFGFRPDHRHAPEGL